MMETGMPLMLFLVGAIIGSWLNVVILRGLSGQRMVWDRSACPSCGHVLRWWELIPVLSFVLLKARCSACGKPISAQYPIVEFFMGIAALFLFTPWPADGSEWVHGLIMLAVLGVLVILFFIDLYTFLLPDFYVVLLAVLSISALFFNPAGIGINVLWSAVSGTSFILLLWLVTGGRGIGFGDVKLMIPLGLLVGVQGVIALLWLAFLLGGMVGLYLLASRQASMKTAVPFGPYLIGATVVILFFTDLPGRLFSFVIG